jgi:hypothetical protein
MRLRLQRAHLRLLRITWSGGRGDRDAGQHERCRRTCEPRRRSCSGAAHEGGTVAEWTPILRRLCAVHHLRALDRFRAADPAALRVLPGCDCPSRLLASRTCDVPAPPVRLPQTIVGSPRLGLRDRRRLSSLPLLRHASQPARRPVTPQSARSERRHSKCSHRFSNSTEASSVRAASTKSRRAGCT